MTYIALFSILASVLSVTDFVISRHAFKKQELSGRYLGLSALFAGIATIAYTFSIRTNHYLRMSLASSLYFISIDWMLVSLVRFIYLYTKSTLQKSAKFIRVALIGYASLDTLIMAANVYAEHAIAYHQRGPGIAGFAYEMKPLYVVHLAFTYGMVVLVLCLLLIKCFHTPRQYRNQYILLIASILSVVLINAVFLFVDSSSIVTQIDWSVFGYSIGLYLASWSAFHYRENNMLQALSMTIFQNIGQGIVLFDDQGEHIMHNRRVEHMIPDLDLEARPTMDHLLERISVPPDVRNRDDYSVHIEPGRWAEMLRCDYRRLRSRAGEVIGNLFVFTRMSSDIDLLTGFENGEACRRELAESPYRFPAPTAVVGFDIMRLGDINQVYGREVGDQRIRNLSRLMREHLPKNSVFMRGYEAHLVAICSGCRETDLLEPARRIQAAAGGSVIFGFSETTESRDVISAITLAGHSVDTKKLLDIKTLHSQRISSLVQALSASDTDTKDHVLRTQKMGAALGERIGLNDVEQTDLMLLCLLHDIGKIGVPLEILNKPGRLTSAEWAMLQSHTEKGYQIAKSTRELADIAPMILYHHERWDGKGYPQRLSGEEIPLLSRIISIVDSYDAMVNNRSYRSARSPEEAQEEIRRCAGSQFDPHLAEVFLQMLLENPDMARGERVGGDEVRVFIPYPIQTEETGSTFIIPYSRYVLNMDDLITEVDDQFETITGYSREEAVGRLNQGDLIPEEIRAHYFVQVNKSFDTGNVAYLKHPILRKDGQRIWVVCCGKRFFDSAEHTFRSEILIFRSTGGSED